jgi:hypothetical protein
MINKTTFKNLIRTVLFSLAVIQPSAAAMLTNGCTIGSGLLGNSLISDENIKPGTDVKLFSPTGYDVADSE